MSDDLKERLDVLIRTEQTGSRLLMQLGIDALARIKELERPCASCTSDNPCSFGALTRIAELEAQQAEADATIDAFSKVSPQQYEKEIAGLKAQLKAAREALEAIRFNLLRAGYLTNSIMVEGIDKVLDPKPTATGETP